MKKSFYPYSGPAGRDDLSHPYPKWYYPDGTCSAETANNVQKFLDAIDGFSRHFKSGISETEIWFLGKSEKSKLLPEIAVEINAKTDEQSQIYNFTSNMKFTGMQEYPGILFLMYDKGIPTRLMKWNTNAFTALYNALNSGIADGPPSNAAVWCLNPSGLNHAFGLGEGHTAVNVPVFSDSKVKTLFGKAENSDKAFSRPFAVYGPPNGKYRTAFTVFPKANAAALENMPDSSGYLSEIIIPGGARYSVLKQLSRYGIAEHR